MAPTSSTKEPASPELKLTINGQSYILGPEIPPDTTLLRFIRNYANLPGTKALCYEGGCGLCTVIVTKSDHENDKLKTHTIRSCQTLVYACVGWSIITIEHLGNQHEGYDKLQVALDEFYGTQCGYCTPGFVMSMKGAMLSSDDLKMEQIEKALDGNICRCTGYRPILDAFKSFGSDAPKHLTSKLHDIEEAYQAKCHKTGMKCTGKCDKEKEGCGHSTFTLDKNLLLERNGITWHYPKTIEDIYNVIKTKHTEKVRFVVGNTGQGVYKNDGPFTIYVNTTGVKELYSIAVDPLVIGANVSLNRCIEAFHSAAEKGKGYQHLKEVAKHWEVVANVGVRNIGSWSGNLKMKHDHNEFVSDIFISLVALEAQITVGRCDGEITEISAEEFLSLDMRKRIILSMKIPPQPENVILRSYKITPRSVNAHAYVNACFRFHVDHKDQLRIINRPALVFGGINPTFIRATNTEKFLLGKQISNSKDINEAIKILGDELKPNYNHADAAPEFRKSLAQCLLYKTVINILGNTVSSDILVGGEKLERPVSSSKQIYDANEDTWPIGEAIPKLESKLQISGEAEYLDDIPLLPHELQGAFVQSTIARGEVKSIDASECLKVPGVVDFITASDIPGTNSFFFGMGVPGNDPIFANGDINYYGQSIGLVVAESKEIAVAASKRVKVTYQNTQAPVLTIKEGIEKGRATKSPNMEFGTPEPIVFGDVEAGYKNSKHIIEGEISFGSQYHFQMEPIAGRAVPVEDGYDVWCTTQWPTETQNAIAKCLKIPANEVNLTTRRIGGGYGGKISRANITVCAASVAARKLQKPVRVVLDITTQMTLVGWREPYYSKYKVGFNDDGMFESIGIEIYSDVGFVANDNSSFVAGLAMPSVYYSPNWLVQPYSVLTDTAANTWCRTPGHVEGVGTMENIIEKMAHFLKKDPLAVREINFTSEQRPQFFCPRKGPNVVQTSILPLLKKQTDFEARQKAIADFNRKNKWRKRGMSVIPLCYPFNYFPFLQYSIHVAIYEFDGTVAIKHGGIEMGQGINTKVAQVAAKALNVPVDIIKVKQTDTFVAANSTVTGGSYGSEINAHGVKICCERIRERMNKVAETITSTNGPTTWTDLVKKCFAEQVDLSERYFTFANEHPKGYEIWAAGCTEVELDVLTGQFLISRSDIIEDCGRSISPYVDVGQVEGAFVMGLGMFTCEKIKHDPNTGERISNNTWEYKVPLALDIPVDFRVTFLPNADNEFGVVRSKATGEPPLCISYSVVTALREAIKSKRADDGDTEWFDMDGPMTVEKIHELCNIKPSQFKF